MSEYDREIVKNLFLMGEDGGSNATARSFSGQQSYERHSIEEELMAEADTEELTGECCSKVGNEHETIKDDDPDRKSLPYDHHLDQFTELDQEVERYVTRALSSMESPPITSKPLLQRIFANLRSRLFSADDDSQRPEKFSKDQHTLPEDTQSIGMAISLQADPDVVTCRICDMQIDVTTLDGHTEWCSKYQDGLLKKEKCAKYLYLLLESLPLEDLQLRLLVAKALEIDEEIGRPASVRLAKLLYKIAKISSFPSTDERNSKQMIKRLQYLVDQKRILAERFLELKPALSITPMISEASSGTDSSIDSTPKRPQTPVAKLTTMLSALLRGGPRSVSKSPQFSASPNRLRASLGSRSTQGMMTSSGTMPKISDFEIIKPISRGAFGSVYLARKHNTHDLYAIKALRKDDLIRKNMTSAVLTERRLLSLAQAPYTVMLYYAFESKDFLFLVMEYLNGGDLCSRLQVAGRFSEAVSRFYLAEVVQAVEYLHDHGIIHRDIKPDNMLLDGEGHVKLTDFGLAKLYSRRPPYYRGRLLGTPEYMAPEIVRGLDHGTAVDWWALGVCMFEFLIGVPPFGGGTAEQIFTAIESFEGIDWESFSAFDLSPEARSLMDGLLEPDPGKRFGSQGVKTHPFFHLTDWSGLRENLAPWRPVAPCDPLDTSNFDARNKRYEAMGVPVSFLEAEPVDESCDVVSTPGGDSTSGFSTPGRTLGGRRTSSSPFDGFTFKNIDLLSQANRKLSSTPSAIFTSPCLASRTSSGTLSDGGFGTS